MPRTNESRRAERAKRKFQFERLRLQADILCDSHKESEQTVVLSRMMNIILDVIGDRGLNDARREALADHFTDCAANHRSSAELGGTGDKDSLYLDGAFRISDLAKRLTWSEAREGQTIEVDHARN